MNSHVAIAIACLSLSFAACAQDEANPTITVDYEQLRHDRMLELQRQELGVTNNQWPRFRKLMDEIKPFLDEERDTRADLSRIDINNDWAGWGMDPSLWAPEFGPRSHHEAEFARVLSVLDAWRHRRFFELTEALAQLEGVMHPPDVHGQPSHVKLTDHRELARVQAARLHTAADRGDHDDRFAAFAELVATHQTIVWFGEGFDSLVAEDGVRTACEHLLKAHLRHPITDDAWLANADAVLSRYAQKRWLPNDALIASLRAEFLDHVQRTYTDDGAGDGVFLPDEYNKMFLFFENALADYDGPFATRREAAAWLERYIGLLGPLSTATGQGYLHDETAIRTHIDSIGARMPASVDLAPAYLKMVRVLRGFEIRVAGTRVVLAIERYRLANDGAIPDSLDELGDVLPETLRTDPLSGEPWVYHAYPTSITEFGRDLLPGAKAWPYQLWSRALPGIEQATEWSSDPTNGVLITVPLQAPQYDAP